MKKLIALLLTIGLTLSATSVFAAPPVVSGNDNGTATGLITIKKPENPTKEGNDFVYWCDDVTLTNEFKFSTTAINENKTLYAKWTESVYSVSFNSEGGSDIDIQEVSYNNKVVFPAIPTKENFVFEKWQSRKEVEGDFVYEEFDFSTPITKELTLYALWFGGDTDD